MSEKRKFIRHDALNLLDYLIIDSEGQTGEYSMARTLDVSYEGLKLEISHCFDPDTQMLITLGLEDKLVDLTGRVIYCQPRGSRFIAGVSFDQIEQDDRRVLSLYINAFNKLKES